MLIMVVERFIGRDAAAIWTRFSAVGRMMPPDVKYISSWIEPNANRCYQLMEAPSLDSLTPWIDKWNDLMEFELIPVLESREFWREFNAGTLPESLT
jgi:hypothetical protein